jgi:indolepyruvate ferredoxin oxidoreductase beta subunit
VNTVRYILDQADQNSHKKDWLTGFIPDGAADLLIATEMSEALRNAKFVSKRTEIIMNTFELRPMGAAYPDKAKVLDFLQQHARHVYPIDASQISMGEFNSYRLTNFILLGVALFQTKFPLKRETFDALLKRNDQKKALRIGFDLVQTSSERP